MFTGILLTAALAAGPDPAVARRESVRAEVLAVARIIRIERIKLEDARQKLSTSGEIRRLVEFE